MSFLTELFGTEKPIIGLVHIQPLPGDPFYKGGGMDAVVRRARADLEALQNGGVDGVLFTNEFSMPYEKHVSSVTMAAMGMVIGALKSSIRVPFGAEAIFDGDATIALCAATEADFTRCLFTGVWAGDFGMVDRDIAVTLRLKNAYRLDNLKLFYFVTSEGDACVGGRKTADVPAHSSLTVVPMPSLLAAWRQGSDRPESFLNRWPKWRRGRPLCVGPDVSGKISNMFYPGATELLSVLLLKGMVYLKIQLMSSGFMNLWIKYAY